MTIKRIVFRTYIRLLEKLCLSHPAKNCFQANLSLHPLSKGNQSTDIVTIAFNNDQIIPIHIEYIQKYWQDEHTHIIADNSTDKKVSENIKTYCVEHGVSYIRLPKNFQRRSYSHATALNWVYKHVISKRRPAFFGFTDHDLFPYKAVSLVKTLQTQHIYGPLRVRGVEGKYWYISAILCFFDFNFVRDKNPDFMPVRYGNDLRNFMDTGGGNWLRIYSKIDQSKIIFCKERLEKIGNGDDRHNDFVEIFDDTFLHTINGADLQYDEEQIHQSKNWQLRELIGRFE